MKRFVLFSVMMLMANCAPVSSGQTLIGPVDPQAKSETEFAKDVLSAIQSRSIAENREYCGIIGLDQNGMMIASVPMQGDEGSCVAFDPPGLSRVTASYHTHGGASGDYVAEVPSLEDVDGDAREGINGYVSSPGGRIWFVDGAARSTMQICGLGCIQSDPQFTPGSDGPIADRYSYEELAEKLGV